MKKFLLSLFQKFVLSAIEKPQDYPVQLQYGAVHSCRLKSWPLFYLAKYHTIFLTDHNALIL
ncbi:hypothetical protein EP47_12440 [Legionella norrlandica]|uniref:Uncharacterized protein n=1 Tax=Legionella norrlandica TaxID=1498499 RepID=A0A0A2SVT5_9GAMM|nr:hypothetical protein EP47_12440 [Legionella norrlandica]